MPPTCRNWSAKGASTAIGSVEDEVPFLTAAFTGADAIYLMNPPNYASTTVKDTLEQVGKNYASSHESRSG